MGGCVEYHSGQKRPEFQKRGTKKVVGPGQRVRAARAPALNRMMKQKSEGSGDQNFAAGRGRTVRKT